MNQEITQAFSPRDFIWIFFKHKNSIALLFFTILLTVVVAVYVLPETYESSATLLVKLGRENASSPATQNRQQVIMAGVKKEDINSEIRILKSNVILGQVIEKVGLENLFAKKLPPKSFFKKIKYYMKKVFSGVKKMVRNFLILIDLRKKLSDHEIAMMALEGALGASQEKESYLIRATFRWSDPEGAKQLLQLILDLYKEHHLQIHKSEGNYQFFQSQIQIVEERLLGYESDLSGLMADLKITSFNEHKKYLQDQLNTSKTSSKYLQTEIAEVENRFKELKRFSLKRRLSDSEGELQKLNKKYGVSSFTDQRKLILQQISSFESTLRNVDTDIVESREKLVMLKTQLASQDETIMLGTQITRNPMINSLKNTLLSLELEKKKLEATFAPESRQIKDVSDSIYRIRKNLEEEHTDIIEEKTMGLNTLYKETQQGVFYEELSLSSMAEKKKMIHTHLASYKEDLENLREYEVFQKKLNRRIGIDDEVDKANQKDEFAQKIRLGSLKEKKKMIEQHIASYTEDLDNLKAHETEHKNLERQIKIDYENLQLYKKRLEEARIVNVLDKERIVNIKIVDLPFASSTPVKPRKLLLIGIGLALGLLTGTAYAFAYEYVNKTVETPDEVRTQLGLLHLGSLRDSSEVDKQALEALRSSLFMLDQDKSKKTIMVCSSSREEGTTHTARHLAATMAEHNNARILLIDANLREPSLANIFKSSKNRHFSEMLEEGVRIEELIAPTKTKNLSLLLLDDQKINPSIIFESPVFKDSLNTLRGEYDYIIIDACAINPYHDSHALASLVDGVILVVLSGVTRKEVIQRAKEYLAIANAKVIGVVLNKKRYYIPEMFYKRL